MKTHRKWSSVAGKIALKLSLWMLAGLWLVLVAASWTRADEQHQDSIPRETDEYQFRWLDPDKKIYVLQNRRYLKTDRVLISLMPGTGVSSPYRTTWTLDARLAYYLSEAFGLELGYSMGFHKSNNTFKALEAATTGVIPVVREVKSKLIFLAHWVPWYAKINVFNNIIYFDWYFSAGVGSLRTDLDTRTNTAQAPNLTRQSFTAFMLGTGHQYHITRAVTVRLDFSGAFYRAKLLGTTGETSWYSDYQLGLGLGVRL